MKLSESYGTTREKGGEYIMDKDQKKCECGCACCGKGGMHGMMMDCCVEHKMSKEHLENKKKMLEEKLKWVKEELEKK